MDSITVAFRANEFDYEKIVTIREYLRNKNGFEVSNSDALRYALMCCYSDINVEDCVKKTKMNYDKE